MCHRRRALRIAVVAAGLLCAALQQAESKILSQWVQLGPDGTSSVRVITKDACPSVIFNGAAVPMSVRAEPAKASAA